MTMPEKDQATSDAESPADVQSVDGDSAPVDESPEGSVEDQLKERTGDLQRLQAEYVNYRKRVERDRALARTAGEASVLRSLLTVLDDIGRAEQHGELEGGFKAVADALQQAVRAHRLESFGAPGEVFDPRLHEALFHAGESADVAETTIKDVIRTGYRVGEEVIRHAQVGVVDPVEGKAARKPAEPESVNEEPPAGDAGAGEPDPPADEAS